MKFLKIAQQFHNDDDGAVTVDWVVLTAAVVGLGVAALAVVKSGAGELSTRISGQLSGQQIVTTF